jgi:hydroxymethylglutaryl-CoA lyase
MSDAVKIVECPRDAWQGLPGQIASEAKAGHLRRLIDSGFTHIDAVSFVSPATVPQMADSERVLELLGPQKAVEIIGIVVNEKGAERAIRTGAVQTLGFPYSISSGFLRRNQHQTPEESLASLRAVIAAARDAELDVVAYLSMAFGNPYGEAWSIGAVLDACLSLIDAGRYRWLIRWAWRLLNGLRRRLPRWLKRIATSRSARIFMHGATKRRPTFERLTMQVAGGLTRP